MNQPAHQDQPPEATWAPLTGLPEGAGNWTLSGYDDLLAELRDC